MPGFDFSELFARFRYPILIFILGLILILGGFFIVRSGVWQTTKVEVLGTSNEETNSKVGNNITVEIAGEVITPGVYKLNQGDRVNDLLVVSGGFSVNADRDWTNKYLNRAAKLIDGQKVFIPSVGKQSGNGTAKQTGGDQTISSPNLTDSNNLVNINTASLTELDKLPGIGQVYGQNIIEHRPYSNASELLSKGVLKQSLYNKVKDQITVY